MSRSFSRCFYLAGLAFALSACGSNDDAEPKKVVTRVDIPESEFKPVELEETVDRLVKEIAKTEAKSLQLDVVLKSLTGYWEPVKLGANRAFGELDVTGSVVAPTDGTEEEARERQLALLKEREGQGYAGLGLAPLADNVVDEIDTLHDSGTPIVTIDSDLPTSKRSLYIGTINREAGRTAGETLRDMLPGDGGTVIILGHEVEADWPDGYARTQGAKDVLETAGYTVVIRKTNWDDEGAIADVDFMTTALADADPPAVGMLSMFSPTYRCAQAAEAAGLTAEDVTIVGFDFEPQTLSYMQSGMIKATHAQRQYYFGYMAPYVLYSLSTLGTEKTMDILAPQMVDATRFNAGIDVVRSDQVEDYNAYLDSIGIGG
jgi:ribose transport system substrate-binding protein